MGKESMDRLLQTMSMMAHEEPSLVEYVLETSHPKLQIAVYILLGMHRLGKEQVWDIVESHFRGVSENARRYKEEKQ